MSGVSRSGASNNVTKAAKEIVVGNQAVNHSLGCPSNGSTQRQAFSQARGQEPAQGILSNVARRDQKMRRNLERFAEKELTMCRRLILSALLIVGHIGAGRIAEQDRVRLIAELLARTGTI